MRDEWFPHIAFPIPIRQFHELPKNPIYKWEYWDGTAHLSARPRTYHCVLKLARPRKLAHIEAHGEPIDVRLLAQSDWGKLPALFDAAFWCLPPFCGMNDAERAKAARACLKKTRRGGDGPLIGPACFVATLAGKNRPLGAILVTLTRDIDLTSLEPMHWKEPPADAIRRRLGRPHLTWIFVAPLWTRHGIGSLLLDHAAGALVELGYRELASTFLLGNESSTLWHWSNGFRLVTYCGSPRAIDRRIAHRSRGTSRSSPPADHR